MDKYTEIKERFEAHQDSENAVKMAKYMKNLFPFYGIAAPERKKLYKDILKEEKNEQNCGTGSSWISAMRTTTGDSEYVTLDYLTAMQKFLTYDDIPKIWKYIKEKQWWDTIDFFDRIIGEIGLGDSRVDALMLAWSVDEDFWVRRIAIDHQLLRKERTNTELLEQILVNNLGSNEFFINKAIGWSLRDYSKTDPEWVRTFISKYRDRMDKLSIREGSKYI